MWFRCLGIILSPVWPQWRGSISLLSGRPRVRSRVLTPPDHHLCRNMSVYWYKNNCFHFNQTVQAYAFMSVSWEPPHSMEKKILCSFVTSLPRAETSSFSPSANPGSAACHLTIDHQLSTIMEQWIMTAANTQKAATKTLNSADLALKQVVST